MTMIISWVGRSAATRGYIAAAAAITPPGHPAQTRRWIFDVAVIGGGIVGLACSREAAVLGRSVVVLERETEVAAGASSGNSGLACTGYDAPVGSLERQLLRRAKQRHPALFASFGLGPNHIRRSGALVVAWNDVELAELPAVLAENRAAGDTEAALLDQAELRALAGPGLSDAALGAVLCPHEAVVEPWLISIGYAESALRHGAEIRRGTATIAARFDGEIWTLDTQPSAAASVGRSAAGELLAVAAEPAEPLGAVTSVRARVVVNCAGLHGDSVEQLRDSDGAAWCAATRNHDGHSPPAFTVTPRKGQFVVFEAPRQGSGLPGHIIEPVATQFTKGVIVWVNQYGNVVVGPTAVDQHSRTDRSTDADTVRQLRAWAEKVMPGLRSAAVLGTFSGLRPATEHRDYQIKAHSDRNWVTVAGIRSTGLSASGGIAEYVAGLCAPLLGDPSPIGLADSAGGGAAAPITTWSPGVADNPALPGVSEATCSPEPLDGRVCPNGDVPELGELARQYRRRRDGHVEIYGRSWLVTHPISTFGMESHGALP